MHALAVDVSEHGMKLEIAGAPLRPLLDASDPLVQLELVFTHPDLRSMGSKFGHVQWRRAAGDRDIVGLGARFDTVFQPHEMSRMLRVGRIGGSEEPGRAGVLPLLLVFGLALALLLVGASWHRSHSADAAERDRLERRLSSAEDDLSDVRGAEERCRADLSARAAAAAVASPMAAAPLSALAPATATGHASAAAGPTNPWPAPDLKDAAAVPDEPSRALAPAADARNPRAAGDAAVED
jgi:hypothetical protein